MEKYRRKNNITCRGYQLKYTATIILSMVLISVTTFSMLYSDISRVISTDVLAEVLRWETYLFRTGILFAAVFIAAIYFSHKIIGPIHRIYDSLFSINEGEFELNLTLRTGDVFLKVSEEIMRLASALESISEDIPDLPLKIASYEISGEDLDAEEKESD